MLNLKIGTAICQLAWPATDATASASNALTSPNSNLPCRVKHTRFGAAEAELL
jgi:hypothetical protein